MKKQHKTPLNVEIVASVCWVEIKGWALIVLQINAMENLPHLLIQLKTNWVKISAE